MIADLQGELYFPKLTWKLFSQNASCVSLYFLNPGVIYRQATQICPTQLGGNKNSPGLRLLFLFQKKKVLVFFFFFRKRRCWSSFFLEKEGLGLLILFLEKEGLGLLFLFRCGSTSISALSTATRHRRFVRFVKNILPQCKSGLKKVL